MYQQLILGIAMAAVAGAAVIAPLRSASDQFTLSIAAEEYLTAYRVYKALNCDTVTTPGQRVFDNTLVNAGLLDGIHPQIRFASWRTAAGIDVHYAFQDDRTGSNFGDLYRVTGGFANVMIDGFTAMQLDIDEYSQGDSPPGFHQMMFLDEQSRECL